MALASVAASAAKPEEGKPSPTPAGIFNTAEIGVAAGTSGLEFELATPLSKWARLRAGFQYMPDFTLPMDFNMTAETNDGLVNEENFDKISTLMKDLTGFSVDQSVRMHCNPTFYNFKVVADIYPFANSDKALSKWRVSAGFYVGPSRVGKAVNAIEEMPSLLMVGMYNRLYDYVADPDFVDKMMENPPSFGPVSLDVLSASSWKQIQNKLMGYGEVGMHCGKYPDGSHYVMKPGEDGTVRANAFVNSFKPYVGIGTDEQLDRSNHFTLGFDAGALLWGGAPKVVTHEGVELNKLSNLPLQIDRKMRLMGLFKVYPVLNLRIAYRF